MSEALSLGAKTDLPQTVAGQLLFALRKRIIQAELTPGMRLSEQEVAVAYGVSRQPVREVFIRLADEGLLEIRPQRGTFVRKIVPRGVTDARFVREAVEADIVRLAAQRTDPAAVADLRDLIARQEEVHKVDTMAFLRLDEAFHKRIAEMADKRFVWDILQPMKAQMDRVRFFSMMDFPTEVLIVQHRSIVDAMAAADVDGAETAVRTHLRKIFNDLPDIIAKYPQYFEDVD